MKRTFSKYLYFYNFGFLAQKSLLTILEFFFAEECNFHYFRTFFTKNPKLLQFWPFLFYFYNFLKRTFLRFFIFLQFWLFLVPKRHFDYFQIFSIEKHDFNDFGMFLKKNVTLTIMIVSFFFIIIIFYSKYFIFLKFWLFLTQMEEEKSDGLFGCMGTK